LKTRGFRGLGGRPDFGTYHTSTPADSEKTREGIRLGFAAAFGELPFSRDREMKILDVGCGLGFLSCLCAEHYSKASVTGFDIFEHESLRGSSIARATENAKILGLADRIRFLKADIFDSDFGVEGFDLFVSNLVFHNLGERRFAAYERLASWARPGSYTLLGDRFDTYETDHECLSALFSSIEERPRVSGWQSPYRLLVMER
jgi:2-polyprenyl-3-methyl-5-hydroxy-6-metoxy-1,4-benzoquinol methylase